MSLPTMPKAASQSGRNRLGTKFSEEALVAALTALGRKHKQVVLGIGDDAAVLRALPGSDWVWTTDALIEGAHFHKSWLSLAALGRRAALVNLSDLAAMGAWPVAALSSLTFPKKTSAKDILAVSRGIAEALKPYGAVLVGGNVSQGPGWSVSLSLLGTAQKFKTRSSAWPSDGLYVSGPLGGATLGLHALLKKRKMPFVARWQTPTPRLALGQKLAHTPSAHAMMDLSDGLSKDLSRLMAASHARAEVWLDAIPQPKGFASACAKLKLKPQDVLLAGGEDYELLVAMAPQFAEQNFAKTLFRIGTVFKQQKGKSAVTVLDTQGKPVKAAKGWDHLR
jgi:thiamine-monophosphate kinase